MKNKRIAVIGGGSWATALIKIFLDNNAKFFDEKINWWVRKEENIKYIYKYKHNPNYISYLELDTNKLNISNSLEYIIENSDFLIIAIPSAFLNTVFEKEIKNKEIIKNKKLFSAVKGIVPEYNLIVGEYLNKIYNVPLKNIGIICGPCHAEEVAMERLSYLTIASQDSNNAECLANLMKTRYIKTTISDDIYGTEYSSVLKNIMAIASGIAHGLGYGDNFQSVLIANAIQEIKRFVDAIHPINRDIKSSAYLGDLLVTCYSQFSRNRIFGNMIGRGYSIKSAQSEMNMIAEGYYAANCINKINNKLKINMPISSAVYRILYENISPFIEIKILAEKLS